MDLEQAFGIVIREQRNRLGMSQEELSFRCGLHRTYLSQLERGLKSPSLRTVALLAHSLGVSANSLIERAEAMLVAEGGKS